MIDLDDMNAIKEYDKGNMLGALESFPKQCREALKIGEEFEVPEDFTNFDKIIATGMGGSGIVGDLLRRFLKFPTFVSRGYNVPQFVDEKTLLVAISYGGNTEETISSLENGLKRTEKVLCISSDGQLKARAEEEELPFIKIPSGFQPRAALGYLLLPILKVLSRTGRFQDGDELGGLIEALKESSEELGQGRPTKQNQAKQIARGLFGKIPLIYGVEGNTDVVARRWKTQFNENSKQHAFWNSIPEMDHNEIVGFEKAELMPNCKVILLRNDYDTDRNRSRLEIMGTILKRKGVETEEVWATGESELSQILSQIYLGDFVSFYLAILNKEDPTLIRLIKDIKELLKG